MHSYPNIFRASSIAVSVLARLLSFSRKGFEVLDPQFRHGNILDFINHEPPSCK
jgi:hypothetical protein